MSGLGKVMGLWVFHGLLLIIEGDSCFQSNVPDWQGKG